MLLPGQRPCISLRISPQIRFRVYCLTIRYSPEDRIEYRMPCYSYSGYKQETISERQRAHKPA